MINFDDYVNENKTEHNLKWLYIPDHPYRILIIGRSGSGKTNALLNLINNQSDIDKKYLYAKDPYEAKYKFSINKRESTGLKALRQLVWRLLLRRKNAFDWKTCSMSIFSEILSPYKHVLAALFRK